jgi:hypothetical protein
MKVMRNMWRILILTAFVSAWGQGVMPRGLPTKAKVTDYEFVGEAGKLSIGVQYMGRSFSAPTGMAEKTALHDAGNFIVVEVGAFAGKTFAGELLASDFRLRLEGKKLTLMTSAPGIVANALRTRDMDPQGRRLVYGGGMGDAGVIVGAPRPQERFPGDPRPGQSRPIGTTTTQEADKRDWDAVVEAALVEGGLQSARAGNLYFEYSGKMTQVKGLVLEYQGDGGKVEIRIR